MQILISKMKTNTKNFPKRHYYQLILNDVLYIFLSVAWAKGINQKKVCLKMAYAAFKTVINCPLELALILGVR